MLGMTPDLQQQIMSVVRDAGKLSLRWFEGAERNEVSYKGETDLVTVADREVEAFLRKRLHEIMPEAGMVGEEGTDTRGSGGWHFVVDPIDGTTNFVHGLPFYSVSLALKDEKETVLGIVYAPALDWTFHAALGGGAWMSKTGEADRKLHVSKTPKLIKAVAATGFACVRARAKQDNLPIFNDAIYRLQGVRRLGSAALDLCMVADGKLDLYWEMGIQPWDIAAGILILREAGGRATDLLGGDAAETRKEVLASNALVHDEFLDVLRRSYA